MRNETAVICTGVRRGSIFGPSKITILARICCRVFQAGRFRPGARAARLVCAVIRPRDQDFPSAFTC
eukprot:8465204-Prorocentrum_lima.AAC.1